VLSLFFRNHISLEFVLQALDTSGCKCGDDSPGYFWCSGWSLRKLTFHLPP
jgi:hypothetical protein